MAKKHESHQANSHHAHELAILRAGIAHGIKLQCAQEDGSGHKPEPVAASADAATLAEAGISITCDLCNDAAWWPANGFTEAERQQICGPKDLNCPGFGGGDEGE